MPEASGGKGTEGEKRPLGPENLSSRERMGLSAPAHQPWPGHSKMAAVALAVTGIAGLAACGPTPTAYPGRPTSIASPIPKPPPSSSPPPSSQPAAPPAQLYSQAGSLYATVRWPFAGRSLTPDQRALGRGSIPGLFTERFTSQGLVIAGVRWTWPAGDSDPAHYLVVPTLVEGQPVLVWAHLPAARPAVPKASSPLETQWDGSAALWLTPWRPSGGPLDVQAQPLFTIPAVWSPTGSRVTFPGNPADPQSNPVDSAWTGWVPKGWATSPPREPLPPGAKAFGRTMASTLTLYAAYQGVVLEVGTKLLGATQGFAQNYYHCNLAHHRVEGIASLTSGGGLVSWAKVVSGMVITQMSSPLSSGQMLTDTAVFNEVTEQRHLVSRGAENIPSWTLVGNRIENAVTHRILDQPVIPSAVLSGPSPAGFLSETASPGTSHRG